MNIFLSSVSSGIILVVYQSAFSIYSVRLKSRIDVYLLSMQHEEVLLFAKHLTKARKKKNPPRTTYILES